MKKIIVIFLVMLLYFSYITITNTNSTAEGSSGEDTYLDTSYIRSITENLSLIIKNPLVYPPGTLAKGRGFGTKGELFAATEILQKNMSELGLYNPCSGLDPYLDKITNLTTILQYLLIGKQKGITLTCRNEVIELGAIVNHSGNKTSVECQIGGIKTTNKTATNFSEQNLKIIRAENYTCNDTFLKDVVIFYNTAQIPLLPENMKIINQWEDIALLAPIKNNMTKAFQEYYNFTFDNITPGNESTYPEFLRGKENISDEFMFIEEYPRFHPIIPEAPMLEGYANYNEMYPWTLTVLATYRKLLHRAWNETYKPNCKGIIWYDYNDSAYNAGGSAIIPVIFINGSLGREINASVEDYTIDYYKKLRYNESTESYNVIGQINGIDQNKTVLIQCFYDCVPVQGPGDSGTGMAIVLAIAKYFKDHNIIPKYNLKFIGYAGEEHGYIGAYHYEATHLDENIITVIDFNQLGFIQPDFPMSLNLTSNRLWVTPIIKTISDNTNYSGRLGDGTGLDILWTPLGSVSDESVFSHARLIRTLGGNRKLKTVLFLKYGWYRHHRTGENYTKGDSMEFYYPEDVKLTGELALNITKFFTINPNCNFIGIPTYSLWDSDDINNYNDGINVSFTINTTMPIDQVSVRLVLFPKYQWDHPCFPLLYRHRVDKKYIVKSGNDIDGFINTTIPDYFPQGEYVAQLYLCNSTGEKHLQ